MVKSELEEVELDQIMCIKKQEEGDENNEEIEKVLNLHKPG